MNTTGIPHYDSPLVGEYVTAENAATEAEQVRVIIEEGKGATMIAGALIIGSAILGLSLIIAAVVL